MKLEVVALSEILVYFSQITERRIPKESISYSSGTSTLKIYISYLVFNKL
jgi:hypothetical protein